MIIGLYLKWVLKRQSFILLVDFREREEHRFIVLLIYAFIGWFLHMPWWDWTHNLVYRDDSNHLSYQFQGWDIIIFFKHWVKQWYKLIMGAKLDICLKDGIYLIGLNIFIRHIVHFLKSRNAIMKFVREYVYALTHSALLLKMEHTWH